jgi:hypothetical protein
MLCCSVVFRCSCDPFVLLLPCVMLLLCFIANVCFVATLCLTAHVFLCVSLFPFVLLLSCVLIFTCVSVFLWVSVPLCFTIPPWITFHLCFATMSCFLTPFLRYRYVPCYFIFSLFCLSFMFCYSLVQCVGDSLLQVWSLAGSLEVRSSKLVEAISFFPLFLLKYFLLAFLSRFCAIKTSFVRPCCFGYQKSSLYSIC